MGKSEEGIFYLNMHRTQPPTFSDIAISEREAASLSEDLP